MPCSNSLPKQICRVLKRVMHDLYMISTSFSIVGTIIHSILHTLSIYLGRFCHNSKPTNIFLPWNWKFEFWWFLRLLSCPYKRLSIQILKYLNFLSNFQSPKFKVSVSGKKNVSLFGVMTKTSVPSDTNVPLPIVSCTLWCRNSH